MRVYLDANAIIYSIEGAAPFREKFAARISDLRGGGGSILTSRLSRLECRVKPLRDKHLELLDACDSFFAGKFVRTIEIDSSIIEQATHLRVQYQFKTPDAIHLATAIDAAADVFLTGDRKLVRCREVTVDII